MATRGRHRKLRNRRRIPRKILRQRGVRRKRKIFSNKSGRGRRQKLAKSMLNFKAAAIAMATVFAVTIFGIEYSNWKFDAEKQRTSQLLATYEVEAAEVDDTEVETDSEELTQSDESSNLETEDNSMKEETTTVNNEDTTQSTQTTTQITQTTQVTTQTPTTTQTQTTQPNKQVQLQSVETEEGYYSSLLGRTATQEELYYLRMICLSEAGVEKMEGKIAVVACVLNRMLYDKTAPNTVYGVVFQKNAFSSTRNGKFYNSYGELKWWNITKEQQTEIDTAVKRALDGEDPTEAVLGEYGALYFYNPKYCSQEALNSRAKIKVKVTIGNHIFYRVWDT